MIEADGLTKQFDTEFAVRDLDLHVSQGELLALLGPNGAGKTTTVRMLGAILRPTLGRARINGYDVIAEPDRVRRCIGMLTEQPGLYLRMTGLEYLVFFGRLYGLRDEVSQKRALELFERFAMNGAARRRLGTYSKGMRQKVGLIRAMLHDPAALLLDEPTSAMDPHSARLVRDAIHQLRRDRRGIILCTHNLAEAESLADRIAIISQGRIIASGTPDALKRRFLGPPLLEMRLDRPLDGAFDDVADELPEFVDLQSVDGDLLHYRASDPAVANPLLVKKLTELGIGVISLHAVPQSLEDVYLSVLREDEAAKSAFPTRPATASLQEVAS